MTDTNKLPLIMQFIDERLFYGSYVQEWKTLLLLHRLIREGCPLVITEVGSLSLQHKQQNNFIEIDKFKFSYWVAKYSSLMEDIIEFHLSFPFFNGKFEIPANSVLPKKIRKKDCIVKLWDDLLNIVDKCSTFIFEMCRVNCGNECLAEAINLIVRDMLGMHKLLEGLCNFQLIHNKENENLVDEKINQMNKVITQMQQIKYTMKTSHLMKNEIPMEIPEEFKRIDIQSKEGANYVRKYHLEKFLHTTQTTEETIYYDMNEELLNDYLIIDN